MKDWSGDIDLSGNTIAGFPDIVSNGKLIYSLEHFNIFTQLQYVGKQYLDNTENEDRIIDPFSIVNMGAVVNITKLFDKFDLQLNLKANNILDKEYETAGYYDPWGGEDWTGANYYWPAAGRNFVAGLRVGF
jgi:iron complex outermembrane receptor protein